ncbi:MAG: hemolysin III family protein [Puniceicoccales bacterium]|jgi:hemolysin III|nr:hemolysin III family protein [Puniceicoccales bacterium]
MKKTCEQYTLGEEYWHSATHGVGILLSIAGLAALVRQAVLHGDTWCVVGVCIFSSTLILLYSSSTLYHSFHNKQIKRFLRKCDHAAIFLLIAGTYTPFLLVNLRGAWGWSLFGVIWSMALVGIILKFWFAGQFHLASTINYISMGWLALIALKPMLESVSASGMWLLFAGGLCYTGGATFYMMKKV